MSILTQFCASIDVRMPLARRRVLDVGCGDGALVRELTLAKAEVIGVECSAARLDACELAPKVGKETYRFGEAQVLPFAADSFDATVFRASLHHVPAKAMSQALREARRVTVPSGEIFVFEPLTAGAHFELMRLIDDETLVRGQAQEAIERAVQEGWLTRTHSATLIEQVVYADVEALRRQMVAIDASRAATFSAVLDRVRRAFDATGIPCAGGRRFAQPFRLDVLL
jgi:ubiquinone/menaquinone biosynthesis C-methylase UbiE